MPGRRDFLKTASVLIPGFSTQNNTTRLMHSGGGGLESLLQVTSAASADNVTFPNKGQIGLYNLSGDISMLIYRGLDDSFHSVAWYNTNGFNLEKPNGHSVAYRGWGEFTGSGILMHIYKGGSTIEPDRGTFIGDFTFFPNGTASGPGVNFSIENYFDPVSKKSFFGQGDGDGMYFTNQFGFVNGTSRLLKPPYYREDLDTQLFAITNERNETSIILVMIGPGRSALEFTSVRFDPAKGIYIPVVESHPFFHGSGYVQAPMIFPGRDSANWYVNSSEPIPIRFNGRAVRASSMDKNILKIYAGLGPFLNNPNVLPASISDANFIAYGGK